MTTPSQLKSQLDPVIQQLQSIYTALSLEQLKKRPSFAQDTAKLKAEADKADRQYEEEISKREALGGRTRRQTLQEFVLMFFFVSYALLAVSFAVRSATLEGRSAAIKILGLAFLALLFISAFIIRYA